MARTYLERNLEEFGGAGREELVRHALKALKESLSQDKELTVDNTSVGVVGVGENFKLYDGQEIAGWLESTFEGREGAQEGGATDTMDVDS